VFINVSKGDVVIFFMVSRSTKGHEEPRRVTKSHEEPRRVTKSHEEPRRASVQRKQETLKIQAAGTFETSVTTA
jgi:hypothetical protein